MALKAEVIKTQDALATSASEWNMLLEQSQARSIFLTWEWISAWLDAVRPDVALLVVVVRNRHDRLVGLAPFYLTGIRLLGAVRYRCLRVLGDCDSGAEYPDIMMRRGCEAEVLSAVAQTLREHRHKWDCLWLPNVAGWTGAPKRLRDLCITGGFHVHERPRDFGAVTLPGTYDAYFKSLSGNARSSIRRQKKRLEASQPVEFIVAQTNEQLREMLKALFDLHRLRWASIDEAGSFDRQPAMARFYERFAPVALQRGWLRLYGLKVGGVFKAVQYGYAYSGTFYQLQEGYDPSAPKGVGNVLRHLVIKACIEEGLSEYDFLGEYTDHKRRWGAEQRTGCDLFIGKRSLRNALLFSKQIWPTGRYLRPETSPVRRDES